MLWNKLLTIIELLLESFLIVNLVDIAMIGFPVIKLARKVEKESFLIKKANYAEKQGKVECSGYSSAYVYRHLGKEVTGEALYKEIPCKSINGCVFCRGIVRLAKRYGFRTRFYIGNLNALKNTVAKGVPVIVMVRTKPNSRALHFIPVVGYDSENIYVMDSAIGFRNSNEPYYNRVIPIKEFKKLWNTSMLFQPLYFNLFFEINHRYHSIETVIK